MDSSMLEASPPPHALFRHYSELPYSLGVLFTCMLLILGFGYLFALLNIYFTYAGRAGGDSKMLTYEDIVAGYSGTGKGSVLEGALSGPMSGMLPNDERSIIIRWARAGASEPDYDMTVKPIVEKRCFTCHDGRNPHLPNFTSFEGVKKVTMQDTGASIARWSGSRTSTCSASRSSFSWSGWPSATPTSVRSGSSARLSRSRSSRT